MTSLIRRGAGSLLLCLVLPVAGASLRAQPAPHDRVPLATYRDAAEGVEFQFPLAWKRVQEYGTYCQPAAFAPDRRPRAILKFSSADNLYRFTTLDALEFLYGTRNVSAEACRRIAEIGDPGAAHTRTQTIHGIPFTHGEGGACGLSHGIDANVSTTYRHGTCFVFEEDFHTLAPGILPYNTRQLTSGQRRTLQRHLDRILQSVVFAR